MADFNSPAYKRSRAAYIAQCTFDYFILLLVSDAFLAKLLTYIGISDAVIGIISSFVSMAFVIQIFSLLLVRARASRKTLCTVFEVSGVMFFFLLYLVPFIPVSTEIRTILVVLSVILAYASKYLVSSILFKWGNSCVEATHRGSYSATKEMISLITGIIFTTVVGYIIDRFEGIGNIEGGFLFLAVSILILNVCNLVSFLLIKKDDPSEKLESRVPLKTVLANTVGNKNFRSVILLTILWDVARYLSIGFMGVYKTNDLLLSVLAIQIINISGSFCRMLVSKPFGNYSDKHSYAKGFRMGLCIAAAGFFINMFTTPKLWYLIIPFTILYNCCFAGTNTNSFNIAYSYLDEKYITQGMAIKNCVGGLFGFASSILGGRILSYVQQSGNQLFGIQIYGQQILSFFSLLVIAAAIIYLYKVIEKQERKIQ